MKFNYNILSTNLSTINSIKDLGVLYDSKLTFSHHIITMVSNAYKMLGFIRRCSQDFKNPESFKLLYNMFVRSRLEYASIIWDPWSSTYNSAIEMVQNKFIRYSKYKMTLIYPKFEKYVHFWNELNYKSLVARRKIAALIFTFKLLNNLVYSPYLLSQFNFRVPSPSTIPKLITFYCPRTRTVQHRNSPVNNCMTLYNEYSVICNLDVFFNTLNTFKSSCKKII